MDKFRSFRKRKEEEIKQKTKALANLEGNQSFLPCFVIQMSVLVTGMRSGNRSTCFQSEVITGGIPTEYASHLQKCSLQLPPVLVNVDIAAGVLSDTPYGCLVHLMEFFPVILVHT